ncbi:AraC family transcriptional regulator ligand-binding domain-containing protein [uncultured Maribacter sp.]|uniref:AraC family transcriptional regulator n=1 Tax=uncultured Maribacter sp. TaxID=431308 RepID=UPI0030EC9D53|tara:strand:- start:107447 stop:108403 length:957 start_codon:yes stop_codon:yes gene_type:complete
MKILAPHIANLFFYGACQGIDELTLRQHLFDDQLNVCDSNNWVSDKEYLEVLGVLVNKVNNQYFGLYYGSYLNIKALGLIAEISLNASSLEQAIILLQKYLDSTFPFVSLILERNSEHCILRLKCTLEDKLLKNHILDTVFYFIYRELKLMLADEYYPTLQLPYSNVDEYTKLLNATIIKGNSHSIILSNKVLDIEINRKRINEIEYLLPKFLIMLDKKKDGYKSFSLQVRNMILNMCCPELPVFQQLSKQFALSDRTIQRKLTKEGQSFREISDEIKRELSNYLIKGKRIKTQDIAYILGYSEPSAYLHAVKRWDSA